MEDTWILSTLNSHPLLFSNVDPTWHNSSTIVGMQLTLQMTQCYQLKVRMNRVRPFNLHISLLLLM